MADLVQHDAEEVPRVRGRLAVRTQIPAGKGAVEAGTDLETARGIDRLFELCLSQGAGVPMVVVEQVDVGRAGAAEHALAERLPLGVDLDRLVADDRVLPNDDRRLERGLGRGREPGVGDLDVGRRCGGEISRGGAGTRWKLRVRRANVCSVARVMTRPEKLWEARIGVVVGRANAVAGPITSAAAIATPRSRDRRRITFPSRHERPHGEPIAGRLVSPRGRVVLQNVLIDRNVLTDRGHP